MSYKLIIFDLDETFRRIKIFGRMAKRSLLHGIERHCPAKMCAKYGLDTVLIEREEELSMILQNGIFVKPIRTRL